MKHNRVALVFALLFPLLAFSFLFSFVKPVLADTRTVGSVDCPTTIQDCINISLAGDTVFIPAGTYMESLVLNTAVILRGQNQSNTFIQAPAGQRVLWIDGPLVDNTVSVANLTLQDGDVSGGNVCFPFPTNCGGGILITGGAQPNLFNLTIDNNQAYRGGGLYADVGSVLNLSDVTFSNNSSVLSAGGGYFNEGVTITDSLFENNVSTNNVAGAAHVGGDSLIQNTTFSGNETCPAATGICHGGALYGFELNLTVYDSLFENNSCNDTDCDGGGIYLGSSFVTATLALSNTDFVNNSAGRSGGGAVASSFRLHTLVNNGRFEGNTAVLGDGGGLNAYRAVVTGTQFLTNTAGATQTFDNGGGGLDVQTTAVITNALFQGNHSDRGGGGLAAFLGPLTIQNTTFRHNTADEMGGGAYVELLGASISDSQFEGNQTLDVEIINDDDIGNGGGLWVGGFAALTNTDFISNTATNRGGGVYVNSSTSEMVVSDGRFQGNQALGSELFGDGGGGLFNFTQPLTLNNVQFLNNEALAIGGGGLISYGVLTDTGGLFLENRALYGGGLYVLERADFTGSQFVGNSAVNTGGGALTSDYAQFTNVLFQENSSTGTELGQGVGGGLRASEGITLTNSQFISNTAVGQSGGGAAVFAPISMTNSLFQGNQSSGNGGGLTGSFDPINMSDSQFVNNTAGGNGGGLQTSGNIFLTDSLFQLNQSGNFGGGLYTSGSVFLTDSDVLSNTAVSDGGGAFINSNINFTNGRFQGNQSGARGGGVYTGSFFNIDGTEFIGNQAANGGGGFSNFDVNFIDGRFENNVAAIAGGALQVRRNLDISRTTFINNQAQLGGGIAISGTLNGSTIGQVVNSVLSQNQAAGNGGAIYHNNCGVTTCRPLELIHTTISSPGLQPGQAVYAVTGTLRITNSIINNYTTGIENINANVSSGYNVYFGLTNNEVGTVASNNIQTGDPIFVDTAVHDFRLVTGSSALDTGIDLGFLFDILGVTRGLGAGVDIGAYEGEFSPTAVTLLQFTVKPTMVPVALLLILALLTAVTMITFSFLRKQKRKEVKHD